MKFPDWSMYELENNAWDEFGESGDHIVPRGGGERLKKCATFSDAHGKALGTAKVVGQSADGNRTASNVLQKRKASVNPRSEVASSVILDAAWSLAPKHVVQASHGPEYKANAVGLVSRDAMITNYTGNHKGCDFPLDGAPTVANHDFVVHEFKDKQIDLMDYDWPDIGNFDDIDRIFSNCHSTIGQGSTGTADELAWVSSSSHAIYGSEDTFESGLQSSCSEHMLNGTLGHHANTNFFPESSVPASCNEKPSSLDYQKFADWLDANKEDAEAYDREGGIKVSTLSQLSDEYSFLQEFGDAKRANMLDGQYPSSQKIESQVSGSTWSSPFHTCSSSENIGNQSSEFTHNDSLLVPGRKQQLADQKLLSSAVSAPQMHPKQRKSWDSSPSGSIHTSKPPDELMSGLSMQQVPSFLTEISSFKAKNEVIASASYEVSDYFTCRTSQDTERPSSQFSMSPMIGPKGKTKILQYKEQLRDTSLGHPQQLDAFTDKMDPSAVQEGSCMTSVFSDDISLEATSFQQLQDVMDQLDVRTKLCIRDSLYRLAQSAERRHGFSNYSGNDARGNLGANGSMFPQSSYLEFMDAETDTNPIDRSIAHLLFHRPPESATLFADGARAFEYPFNNGPCSFQQPAPIA